MSLEAFSLAAFDEYLPQIPPWGRNTEERKRERERERAFDMRMNVFGVDMYRMCFFFLFIHLSSKLSPDTHKSSKNWLPYVGPYLGGEYFKKLEEAYDKGLKTLNFESDVDGRRVSEWVGRGMRRRSGIGNEEEMKLSVCHEDISRCKVHNFFFFFFFISLIERRWKCWPDEKSFTVGAHMVLAMKWKKKKKDGIRIGKGKKGKRNSLK